MKVREVIRLIENDGWMFVRQNGSHRHNSTNSSPARSRASCDRLA